MGTPTNRAATIVSLLQTIEEQATGCNYRDELDASRRLGYIHGVLFNLRIIADLNRTWVESTERLLDERH